MNTQHLCSFTTYFNFVTVFVVHNSQPLRTKSHNPDCEVATSAPHSDSATLSAASPQDIIPAPQDNALHEPQSSPTTSAPFQGAEAGLEKSPNSSSATLGTAQDLSYLSHTETLDTREVTPTAREIQEQNSAQASIIQSAYPAQTEPSSTPNQYCPEHTRHACNCHLGANLLHLAQELKEDLTHEVSQQDLEHLDAHEPRSALADEPTLVPTNYDKITAHQRNLHEHLPSKRVLVILMVLLTIIPGLENTAVSPAIGQIQDQFNADVVALQTFYIAGLALGQLFWGPFLDKYGRKPIVIITGVVGIIFNMLMVNSSYDWQVMTCRFMQGFFFGGLILCPTIILKDIFSSRDFTIYNSWIVLFLLYAPAIGPIWGGTIVDFFGWQWIFNILTVFMVMLLTIYMWTIPETIEHKRSHVINVRANLHLYSKILRNTQALYLIAFNIGYSFCIYSLPLFVPSLFINHYNIDPSELGIYFVFPLLFTIIGNRLNVWFVSKNFSPRRVWLRASIIQALFTIVNFSVCFYWLGPVGIITAISINLFFNGFQLGNIQTLYLMLFPGFNGTATALMSFLRNLIPSLITNLILHQIPDYMGKTLLLFDAGVIISCTLLTILYRYRYKPFLATARL